MVDENEQPQDLSMPRIHRQEPVYTPIKPIATPALSYRLQAALSVASPHTINNHSANTIVNTANSNSSTFSAAGTPKTTNLRNLESLSNQHYFSTDGLRLISEVAARVSTAQRPTVLRAPIKPTSTYAIGTPKSNVTNVRSFLKQEVTTPNTTHNNFAPPTPRSPLRNSLKECSSWPYHPYLPLAVYGLPSTMTPPRIIDSHRHRSGSVSPPEVDNNSSSPSGSCSSSDSGGSSPEGLSSSSIVRMPCPDCGRRYATLAGLTRHRQFHCLKDMTKSFDCKHCDKKYTSLGALKMHIRTHTLPCKCHLCGKAFSRPWLLQGHIRTHTGEKPFQCTECERCFADRSNLRAHLQTHAEVKKYACRSCPKTFSRMSLLVKHEDHGCPGLSKSIPRPLSIAPVPPSPM